MYINKAILLPGGPINIDGTITKSWGLWDGTETQLLEPLAGVRSSGLHSYQMRSVKPLCRYMEEEELLSTERMHSRYRSCSCWLSLQKHKRNNKGNQNTRQNKRGGIGAEPGGTLGITPRG